MKCKYLKLKLSTVKLLQLFCIKEDRNDQKEKSICNLCKFTFRFFSILMLLITFYTIAVFFRSSDNFINGRKSVFSSILTSILSLFTWKVVRLRCNELFSLLRDVENNTFQRRETKSSISKIILMVALSICLLIPVILGLNMAFDTSLADLEYSDFWFLGYKIQPKWLKTLALFTCTFIYTGQKILFPTVFLMFFCSLTLKLANNLKRVKVALQENKISTSSLPLQSYVHKKLLMQIQKFQDVFSVPAFLLLALITTLGFTGMSLVLQEPISSKRFIISESISYIYFTVVGIFSMTYSASRIPLELMEIKKFYLNAFESKMAESGNSLSEREKRELNILKLIYKRKVMYLTAGGIIQLDRNLAFRFVGGMLTYGFLIIQLNKQ